jgi:hypothetical protein
MLIIATFSTLVCQAPAQSKSALPGDRWRYDERYPAGASAAAASWVAVLAYWSMSGSGCLARGAVTRAVFAAWSPASEVNRRG